MKLTLANIKELKRKSDSPLTRHVCNYVIDRWGDYDDKNMDVFTVIVSGTNTDGNYVSVSFEQAYSISVSHRAETAAVGLYSWNDTVTFSSLTVDSVGSDTEEGTAQQSADLPKKEEL